MVGLLSDVGNTRSLNEDYIGYYEDDHKRVYVIADGMGGHNAGEVASKMAVETVISNLRELKKCGDLSNSIEDAIVAANKGIYDLSLKNNKLSGMGTTITVCLIADNQVCVGNVGDSSCYMLKDNNVTKVTKDHSLVQQLIDNGSISEEEAAIHPNKNIITRALGTNSHVKVDVFKLELCGIIKIILCTDGLTNCVKADEMLDIVGENENQLACEKLIEMSKFRGGRDNISVIVIEGECENDRNLAR